MSEPFSFTLDHFLTWEQVTWMVPCDVAHNLRVGDVIRIDRERLQVLRIEDAGPRVRLTVKRKVGATGKQTNHKPGALAVVVEQVLL